MILAGDIGGTNARLAYFELAGERPSKVLEQVVASRDYPGLEELVADFIKQHPAPVERACFAVAGPVRSGRSRTTNLPWTVDVSRLAPLLRLEAVGLINDLEANAWGIAALEVGDYTVLHAGDAAAWGNEAVVSAGTGLGEAGLYWDGSRHHPFASEGGHADFAPTGELQVELLSYLGRQYDHVSWERVVSGMGLVNLYFFLLERGGSGRAEVTEQVRLGGAAAISRLAAAGDPLCEEALDLFVVLYGAEAGNVALKLMATGGVYLGGGIAPRIVPRLREGGFMRAFTDKGRLRPVLEAIPVRVITNDRTALLGAARRAILPEEFR